MTQTEIKRQLLADLLNGKTDQLQAYKSQQQHSNIRWVIDGRECQESIYIIYLDGTSRVITAEEFASLSPSLSVCTWRILDHSGGEAIPNVDDDYNKPADEPSPS